MRGHQQQFIWNLEDSRSNFVYNDTRRSRGYDNLMKFDNTYAQLPEIFYQKVHPSSAIDPKLIKLNEELINLLEINERDVSYFSGQKLFDGSIPIAMAYSGHQFGHFNPTLGDGRAILLGEVLGKDGVRYDLHLKGSGPTKYSRRGDGLSGLGPVIREYIVSEAMHSLGVPTTRALSITLTGREVMRQDLQPGASMIRIAKGHIRVGTFEYFLYHNDGVNLQKLIDYSINRFNPELTEHKDKNFEFFKVTARKKLKLVAKWMGLGFIHGVMNTDNTNISGETIDYGPCAFMDQYKNDKVFSSIDRMSRYAYSNQGHIALWNLSRFGNCFIPLSSNQEAKVEKYNNELRELEEFYQNEKLKIMTKKLGIFEAKSSDIEIVNKFLTQMENNHQDFTNTFRNLPKNLDDYPYLKERLNQQDQVLEEAYELMNSVNPYIIPRNHQVEKAIQHACRGDYGLLNELNQALSTPYIENQAYEKFTLPPKPEEIVHQTFCGT